MAGESSVKAIVYALFANLGIAIAKSIAAWYTGSGSMLAESIHSFADVVNQLLLLVGIRRSGRAPDAEHPLGYGKTIYFWSLLVAMLLFLLGGVFSIYEGVHKYRHPEPIDALWIAIVVLGVSIVLELLSTLGALREIKKLRGDRSLWEWIQTSRSAELVVVLGEDIGALVGLIVALIFVVLAGVTGEPTYDALGSASIGVVLILISGFLVLRVKSLLIGRSADPRLVGQLREAMANEEHVREVLNVLTLQLGSRVMVAAKLRIAPGIPIEDAAAAINRIERRLQQAFPEVHWTFMEPDVAD